MPLIDRKRYEDAETVRTLPYTDDWILMIDFRNALIRAEIEINGKRTGHVITGNERMVIPVNLPEGT